MSENGIGRRTFLKGTGIAALSAVGVGQAQEGGAQSVVPNSSGTEAPRVKAPANACDCHHHIYDARFPFASPGARMVANFPVGPIMDGGGLNITVMSYLDHIDVGIVVDRDMVDDAWSFMDSMAQALDELKAAVLPKEREPEREKSPA